MQSTGGDEAAASHPASPASPSRAPLVVDAAYHRPDQGSGGASESRTSHRGIGSWWAISLVPSSVVLHAPSSARPARPFMDSNCPDGLPCRGGWCRIPESPSWPPLRCQSWPCPSLQSAAPDRGCRLPPSGMRKAQIGIVSLAINTSPIAPGRMGGPAIPRVSAPAEPSLIPVPKSALAACYLLPLEATTPDSAVRDPMIDCHPSSISFAFPSHFQRETSLTRPTKALRFLQTIQYHTPLVG